MAAPARGGEGFGGGVEKPILLLMRNGHGSDLIRVKWARIVDTVRVVTDSVSPQILSRLGSKWIVSYVDFGSSK